MDSKPNGSSSSDGIGGFYVMLFTTICTLFCMVLGFLWVTSHYGALLQERLQKWMALLGRSLDSYVQPVEIFELLKLKVEILRKMMEKMKQKKTDMIDLFDLPWMRFRMMSYGGICTMAGLAMMKVHAIMGLIEMFRCNR